MENNSNNQHLISGAGVINALDFPPLPSLKKPESTSVAPSSVLTPSSVKSEGGAFQFVAPAAVDTLSGSGTSVVTQPAPQVDMLFFGSVPLGAVEQEAPISTLQKLNPLYADLTEAEVKALLRKQKEKEKKKALKKKQNDAAKAASAKLKNTPPPAASLPAKAAAKAVKAPAPKPAAKAAVVAPAAKVAVAPVAPAAVASAPVVASAPRPQPKKADAKPEPVPAAVATTTASAAPAATVPRPNTSRSDTRNTWATVAAAWKPKANKDSKLQSKCRKLGVIVDQNEFEEHETAPHSVSAAIREVLTVQGFGEFARFNCEDICSLWGSPRDARLFYEARKRVNEPLYANPREITIYRPMVTAADSLRTNARVYDENTVDHWGSAAGLLMVDVYETETGPLTPTWMKKLFTGSNVNRVVVWIGHKFTGQAGVVNGEGAWKRENGKILFRSDDTTRPYLPHDACDWLWNSSSVSTDTGSLTWVQKTAIGDMVMVIFRHVAADVLPHDQPPIALEVGAMRVHASPALRFHSGWTGWTMRKLLQTNKKEWVPSFLWKYLPGLDNRTLYVSEELYSSCSSYVSGRSLSDLTLKQFISKVREEMQCDEVSQLFYRLFPADRPDPLEVVLSIFNSQTTEQMLTVKHFSNRMGFTVKEYNAALREFGSDDVESSSIPWKKILIGIVVLFGVSYLMRRFLIRSKPLAAVDLPELFEEIKRLTRLLSYYCQDKLVEFQAWVRRCVYPVVEPLVAPLLRAYAYLKSEGKLIMSLPEKVFGPSMRELKMMLSEVWATPLTPQWLTVLTHPAVAMAPMLEEVFKHAFPPGTALIVAYEAWKWFKEAGKVGLLAYAPTALMHLMAAFCPLPLAICVHTCWNVLVLLTNPGGPTGSVFQKVKAQKNKLLAGAAVIGGASLAASVIVPWYRKPIDGSRWKRFRTVYYDGPWENRPAVQCDVAKVTPFEPLDGFCPTQNMHGPWPALDDKYLSISGSLGVLEVNDRPKTSMLWIIPHSVPGYVPAGSDWNMWGVAHARILAAPMMDTLEQERAWYGSFAIQDRASFDFTMPFWSSSGLPDHYVDKSLWWDIACNSNVPVDDTFLCDMPASLQFELRAVLLATHPVWRLFALQTDGSIELPTETSMLEWISHLDGPKKARANAAKKSITTHGPTLVERATKGVKIMVKKDEMLFRFADQAAAVQSDDSLGSPQLRARSIANVNPLVAAYCGPVIYEVQQRMKKLWHWSRPAETFAATPDFGRHSDHWNERRLKFKLKIVFASGYTDYDLSCCFELAREELVKGMPYVLLLVQGDDTLVFYWDARGVLYIVEGDISLMDQCQGRGPLRMELCAYRLLGAPVEILRLLEQVAAASYVLTSRDKQQRAVISRRKRWMRDTGGVNTTTGNSHNIAWGYVRAMYTWIFQSRGVGGPSRDFVVGSLAQLGFKAKVKIPTRIEDATFLKGAWYPVDPKDPQPLKGRPVDRDYHPRFDYFWAPLPSRVLKATKALKDPRCLYKTKDLWDGARRFLRDVAIGYSYFAEVPLLRAFTRRWAKGTAERNWHEPYKVQASLWKPRLLAEDMVCRRYGLTPDDIASFEALFPAQPFRFFEHPVFLALARVDYA